MKIVLSKSFFIGFGILHAVIFLAILADIVNLPRNYSDAVLSVLFGSAPIIIAQFILPFTRTMSDSSFKKWMGITHVWTGIAAFFCLLIM
jgi:hypothetical protein